MVDEVTNELFPKNSWIEIHAIEQLNDVVHWYHESSTEKMQELEEEETEKAGKETTNSEEANPVALASASGASSLGRNLLSNAAASADEVVRGIEEDSVGIRHRKNAGVPLIDYTSVVVSGMVRFPAEKTQQFVCGLQFAVIKAYKHSKTQDGYNSEPLIFKTDDLGRFDFAVGPGERWAFVASYDGHDICYGGPYLKMIRVHSDSDTGGLELYVDETTKERPKTNNYVELGTDTIGIQGGETMVFVDVTPVEWILVCMQDNAKISSTPGTLCSSHPQMDVDHRFRLRIKKLKTFGIKLRRRQCSIVALCGYGLLHSTRRSSRRKLLE